MLKIWVRTPGAASARLSPAGEITAEKPLMLGGVRQNCHLDESAPACHISSGNPTAGTRHAEKEKLFGEPEVLPMSTRSPPSGPCVTHLSQAWPACKMNWIELTRAKRKGTSPCSFEKKA